MRQWLVTRGGDTDHTWTSFTKVCNGCACCMQITGITGHRNRQYPECCSECCRFFVKPASAWPNYVNLCSAIVAWLQRCWALLLWSTAAGRIYISQILAAWRYMWLQLARVCLVVGEGLLNPLMELSMIINYPSKQRLILTDQYRHLHCCYRLAALISKSKKMWWTCW